VPLQRLRERVVEPPDGPQHALQRQRPVGHRVDLDVAAQHDVAHETAVLGAVSLESARVAEAAALIEGVEVGREAPDPDPREVVAQPPAALQHHHMRAHPDRLGDVLENGLPTTREDGRRAHVGRLPASLGPVAGLGNGFFAVFWLGDGGDKVGCHDGQ
jgi:hypothetical protein